MPKDELIDEILETCLVLKAKEIYMEIMGEEIC